jgi:uncharacterized membrane protein YfcA
MHSDHAVLIALAFFIVAILYTTVGHAGASGYLAVMALAGVAPATMRPTALALNIVVAGFTVYRFRRARLVSWKALTPFLVGSLPLAAYGGALRLANHTYYAAAGAVLLLSAIALFQRTFGTGLRTDEGPPTVRPVPAVGIGAAIGLLSGLTGTGGGIFLSPTILFLGWAGPKTTAGISAPFILANSLVALAAGTFTHSDLPPELPYYLAVVLAGATVGTWLGLRKLPSKALLALLAVVMALAAAKLLLM